MTLLLVLLLFPTRTATIPRVVVYPARWLGITMLHDLALLLL